MSVRLLIILLLFSCVATAQTTVVYFEFGSAEVTKETRATLDKIISSKIVSIGINGHTDQMGSDEYNEWLSVERAKNVKKYLVAKGVAEDKISVVRGFGAQRLISDKLDEFSRQLNRRVVLTNNYTPTAMDLSEASRQAALEKPATPDGAEPLAKNDSVEKVEQLVRVEEERVEVVAPKVEEKKKAVPPVTEKKKIAVVPPVTEKKKVAVVPPVTEKKKVAVVPPVTEKKKVAVVAPVTEKKEAPVVKQQQSEKLIEDIQDKNTKAGENIALKNINFYEGSHEFLPSASRSLNDLLETLQKLLTLEVEIQGHVCCQDGDMDGMDVATGELTLSVNRAKAVYEFLTANGIDKSRLSYKGLAHKFPIINVEVTEDDRVVNRRVEIKIIKK